VLIVGGTCARYRLEASAAQRLGEQVCALARSVGGSVFAITSPRTGAAATAALRHGLGDFGQLHEWRPRETDNPYMGYLALADAIVVTGESESMLAEAAAAAKPLFIYPLAERPLGFRRLSEWVARRAESRPRKLKGTVRPQQGLEYICARLIEAGIVRPPRHLDRLHRGLIEAGAAHAFGAPFDINTCRPLREVDLVARRVRLLLGFGPAAHPDRPQPDAPNPREREAGAALVRRGDAQRRVSAA
jgi:mitochondrial fission protein ELM1